MLCDSLLLLLCLDWCVFVLSCISSVFSKQNGSEIMTLNLPRASTMQCGWAGFVCLTSVVEYWIC